MIDDTDESANGIFTNARQLIMDNDLDFNGLTAFGADNTNVNVGENHSVYSLFKEESPDILKGIKVLVNWESYIFGSFVFYFVKALYD